MNAGLWSAGAGRAWWQLAFVFRWGAVNERRLSRAPGWPGGPGRRRRGARASRPAHLPGAGEDGQARRSGASDAPGRDIATACRRAGPETKLGFASQPGAATLLPQRGLRLWGDPAELAVIL